MLSRLASAASRHPHRLLVAGGAWILLVAVLGVPAQTTLKARYDFEDPGSSSAAARARIERVTGAAPYPGILVLVRAPVSSAAVGSVAAALRRDHDVAVLGRPAASRDGREALLPAVLRAGVDDNDAVARAGALLARRPGVLLGGSSVVLRQVNEQVSSDLTLAEAIVLPLLVALSLLFFRGRAALLPLLGGATSVLTTFAILRLVNTVIPLSIFALNLVIGLGLGLAVDYSLFIVARFREELARGPDRIRALRTTMATAGRTVAFSSLTVATALASLIVFPMRFLQSMGIGGAVVALSAAAAALTLLPPALMLMAPSLARRPPTPAGEGRWYRFARGVMRRPGRVAVATAAAMLILALPSLGARWSGVDASDLPSSRSAAVVAQELAARFDGLDPNPLTIALTAGPGDAGAVGAYARRLAAIPQVAGVQRPRYLGERTWELSADARGSAISAPAQAAVNRARSIPTPLPVAVGGDAADFHDRLAAIGRLLPLSLALLTLTTLLILWVMTGSVVLPFKALVMNALTVGVATGALVWIFQDGRFSGPLGYRSQGGIESGDFLVLVAVAFALSTDYGVFLLTRIKEANERGMSSREAVAAGVQRTGAIVTAAALLLAVAIGAFAISKMIFIKELGVGVVVAVLVDAFIVRSLLVPSLMALLGEWNWWQPAMLRGVHGRLGAALGERAP